MNSSNVASCLVAVVRESRGLSQAELARRCGLSRQAIHVIEAGGSVPSVLTAYKLAEALNCTLEEIFPRPGADEASLNLILPVKTHAVTPRLDVARVRQQWIGYPSDFPGQFRTGFRAADALLQSVKPGPRALPLRPKQELEKNIIVFGCDPGLGLVRDHLASVSRIGRMVWQSASSQQALKRLEEGQAHVAGIHFVGSGDSENVRRASRIHLPEGGVLMRFAHWEMGWLVAQGNPKRIRDVNDLARRDVRFLNREKGSGSRHLLDALLDKAGVKSATISGYEKLVGSHNEGGEQIALGQADVAMGLRSVAMVHELDFLPIAQVGFDLVIPKDLLEHPTVAQLCEALQGSRLKRELQSLPGYETGETGRVIAELAAV